MNTIVAFLTLSVVGVLAAPQYGHNYHQPEYHHEAPAHYSFHYDVKDTHTGDIKSHHEERNGDHTKGEYSLIEPDGTKRTVQYTVEGKSGFNAVVHREGGKHGAYEVSHYSAPKYSAPSYHQAEQSYHHAAPAPSYHHAPAPAPIYHHAAPAAHSYAAGGHATSSQHFSTHGAKISTSIHHVAPAPKKYY